MTNNYSHIHYVAIIILLAGCLASCTTSTVPSDQVHGNKGADYWEQGKLDLAERETRRAIYLNPNSSAWHQNLGFILNSAGRYEESIQALEKSLEINENWGNAHRSESLMDIGYYYYSQRKYKKSISTLNKALDTAAAENLPPDRLALLYLYLSFNYTNATPESNPYYDLDKAQVLKTKAYELNPNDLFIKASITTLLILQNNVKSA